MKLPRNEVLVGDAKKVLDRLPENSVDMSMTSPPYWGLRDYGEESVTVWGGDPNCEHQWVPHKVSLEHENRNFQEGTQEEVHGEKGTTYIKKYDDKKADFCQKCGAWKGQLGLEPTPDLFVKHLVSIFEKLKKPLKPWGTLYVVISDTYSSFGGKQKEEHLEKANVGATKSGVQRGIRYCTKPENIEIPQKCLCMIPERFAMAMIQNGWILRNKTIWHKPNAMPSSVKDRLNTTWEYVYMFAQRQKYWWNLDAIREPHKTGKWEEMPPIGGKKHKGEHPTYSGNTPPSDPKGKNPGDIIKPEGEKYKEARKAHSPGERKWYWAKKRPNLPPATELVTFLKKWKEKKDITYKEIEERMGYTEGDTVSHWFTPPSSEHGFSYPSVEDWKKLKEIFGFGDQYDEQMTETKLVPVTATGHPKGKNPGDYWNITTKPFPKAHFAVYPPELCKKPIKAGCPKKVCQKCGKPKIKKPDFKNIPVCRCDEPEWKNGVVLDPFAGAGSTWVMARKLGRDFLGIEIVEEYAEMARERIPDARLDKFL